MVDRGKVVKRLLLASMVVGQVTLAPVLLFSMTYLPDIDAENWTIGVRTELAYWVFIAGISYGLISLALAIFVGGYLPYFIVNRGGLASLFRLSRLSGDPEMVDRSRLRLQATPYGRMARLVHQKTESGEHELMAVHGGLQLLAVPMQVILIAVPLVIMEVFPESMIRPGSAFEIGMAGYIVALWIAVRVHPIISWHLVGVAAMFRNVVWRISRLSWILPILLYWIVARIVLVSSLNWLDVDYSQWHEMQLEEVVLQSFASDAEIPETAILDYIVAISVLPMSTFTTISVLGGSQHMPSWMFGQESGLESLGVEKLESPRDEKTDIMTENEDSEGTVMQSDENIGEDESDSEGRMIDLPFSLFDDS